MNAAATAGTFVAEALYRLSAHLVWRDRLRVARKLAEFAATEAGSALDMLKAAELTDGDPRMRRLFFRHALDESRHAELFRAQARRFAGDAALPRGSDYDRARATRQDLRARLGLCRFLAFVHVAERRGELQFRVLERHFRARGRGGTAREPAQGSPVDDFTQLAELFARIRKDERFHVAYTARLLRRLAAAGQAGAVRRALFRVRATRALDAWRRAGRVAGDVIGRAVATAFYLALLWPFALLTRRLDPARPGWSPPRALPATLEDARRQR